MKMSAMSLKARIRNIAKSKNINPQILLQNFMFERFLERLSLSEYKDNFIIKGGMLITAIIGIDIRSTMDLDATFRGMHFSFENISEMIATICNNNVDDGVVMTIYSISPIRSDDVYGGFRVKINAILDNIIVPFSIDVSTGDIITPHAVKYVLRGVVDENKQIEIWAYNIETVMAEKLETIFQRNILSTRPRDFYDVYILSTTQTYNSELLGEALIATAKHRGTLEQISDKQAILSLISNSDELKRMWDKYRNSFNYASEISYERIIKALYDICQKISQIPD